MLTLPLPALAQRATPVQPALGSRDVPIIAHEGLRFRDLNRNGTLDGYEDWRRAPAERARDLVARMTLEEQAGAMMHGTARSVGPMGIAGVGPEYDLDANRTAIVQTAITSMITRLSGAPEALAAQNNRLQQIAEDTRLGIPVTVSTDPRHHFQETLGASAQSRGFSRWPETLGLAATRDAALVRQFGDIARQEYRAVGIHMTLSPQADLATEPRWSRINGTFGEDAVLTGSLVRAYVEGFQHGVRGTSADGVLAVVKHWVGYGAAKGGFDSHNAYGRYATFPGRTLDHHIRPFLGAFAAGVAGVMPTYSILQGAWVRGRPLEQVGAGFNRQLLTDVLRRQYGFAGVILTDWLITADCGPVCEQGVGAGQRPTFEGVAMPWGVEHLTREARFVKAVDAGVDQFGGVEEAHLLVQAVRAGRLTEARLAQSATRVMQDKFRQGLFENPYVDTAGAALTVGKAEFQEAANAAQRRSLVLLENRDGILPLASPGKRVYLHRIDAQVAAAHGMTVVTDLAQADVAIVRADAPFEILHPGFTFGAMQHEGNLGFRDGDAEYETIKRISEAVPTIVSVYLDRPAILTAITDRVRGLVANFGVSDAALFDVLTGRAKFQGRLPFELPSSMRAVEGQRSDVANDSEGPLYPLGFGRRYQ